MLPCNDGYAPWYVEGEEIYVDWFRPGNLGIWVQGDVPQFGIVERDWNRRDTYLVLPREIAWLFRWVPTWGWWPDEVAPHFKWALQAAAWRIWWCKPWRFGIEFGLWGFRWYGKSEEVKKHLPDCPWWGLFNVGRVP